MSGRLGMLAAQHVGRAVVLADGRTGTVTRITGRGLTVAVVTPEGVTRVHGVTAETIARWP